MAKSCQVQEGECAGDLPTMIRVIRICRNCGAKILSDAPEGLCSGCVLEAALGISPGAAAEVVSCQRDKQASQKATLAAELLGELGEYELLEEVGRGGEGRGFRGWAKI